MPKVNIDNTLYLQVRLAHKYMKRHNITIEQFRQQDHNYDILGLLEDGYEPYHLTGDEGVLDEIDAIKKVLKNDGKIVKIGLLTAKTRRDKRP